MPKKVLTSPFICLSELQALSKKLEKPLDLPKINSLIANLLEIQKTHPDTCLQEIEQISYQIYQKGTQCMLQKSLSYASEAEKLTQQLKIVIDSAKDHLKEIDKNFRFAGTEFKMMSNIKNYFRHLDDLVISEKICPPSANPLQQKTSQEDDLVLIEDIYGIAEDLYHDKKKKAYLNWSLLPEKYKKQTQKFSEYLSRTKTFEDLTCFQQIQVMLALAQAIAIGEEDPFFLSQEDIKEIFNAS